MTLPSGISDPVAIVGGSGALGTGLALRLAAAGVPVLLGSRDLERATQAADKLRLKLDALAEARVEDELVGVGAEPAPSVTPMTNAEAVHGADVVFLCVPFRNHSETFTTLRGAFRAGQILVDATVPLAAAISGKATRTIGVWQGSAAQQAQEMLPGGVHVVSALHTVAARTLGDLGHTLGEDVLLCADERADKVRVAALIERIDGLRCVDAGPLEQARIVEGLTAVLIGINVRHKAHAGIRITGLPAVLWPELINDEEPS